MEVFLCPYFQCWSVFALISFFLLLIFYGLLLSFVDDPFGVLAADGSVLFAPFLVLFFFTVCYDAGPVVTTLSLCPVGFSDVRRRYWSRREQSLLI